MKDLYATIGVLLLSLTACFSQSALPQVTHDSLWGVWIDDSKADTARHGAMVLLIKKGYLYSSPDSALHYAGLLLQRSELLEHDKLKADAYNIIGSAHYVKGDVDDAVTAFGQSLILRRQLGDQRGIAGALNNIGSVYFSKGRYTEALDHYEQSLEAKEALGDYRDVATTLNNIGNVLMNQGDYFRAMDVNLRSLKIREELGDVHGISSCLNNIAIIHGDMGDFTLAIEQFERSLALKEQIGNRQGVAGTHGNLAMIYLTQGDRESAKASLDKALHGYQALGDKRGEASTLTGIGDFYMAAVELDSAASNYAASLRLFEGLGDSKGMAGALAKLAKAYLEDGDADKAIVHAEKALILAQKNGLVTETKDAAEVLYRVYKVRGSFRPAFEMYELYVTMRDSIRSEETQRVVMRQQFQYDFDKKEVLLAAEQDKKDDIAREELTRERAQRNLMGLGFLMLLITGGGTGTFLYQRRRAEYRYRSARSELKALQAQMRPHFIFNALNSINNHIEANDPQTASEYLIRFSKLMRTTLNSTLTEQVTLHDEMRSWENYLELERLNFRHGLSFNVVAEANIDQQNTLLPPLLVQPLLENALWHGISPKLAPGHVEVHVSVADGLLTISVTDDGVGRHSATTGTDRHPGQDSVGISLTKERIALLDGGRAKGTGLFLTDLPIGLRAELRLPMRKGL